MPSGYIERQDIASVQSNKVNSTLYPNVIMSVQQSFGVADVPIYLYNIAHQEFNIPRPPNHPHMLLKACPMDKEYEMVGQITHPFREESFDQNNNKIIVLTDGYVEATKMLNPINPGTDQDWHMETGIYYGLNLNKFGCFWSTHNPPLASELQAAQKRLEDTYRAELKRMADIEARDPQGCHAEATALSHAAANYFGESRSWHRTDLAPKTTGKNKVECPNCGEMIRADAKFHALGGTVCVLPTREAWMAAVNAGVKKMEDVPDFYLENDIEEEQKPRRGRPPKSEV